MLSLLYETALFVTNNNAFYFITFFYNFIVYTDQRDTNEMQNRSKFVINQILWASRVKDAGG